MRLGRMLGFLTATIFLACAAALCVVGTVHSQNAIGARETEQFYLEKENEFLQDTRAYLSQAGFRNSGVTVTRVVEADGTRNYTVTVHHDKIDAMDESARKNLQEELSQITFPAEHGSIYHEFLIIE